MRTLRARLLLGTAVGTALILLVFSVALYALVKASLWRDFDDSLATKARSLATLVEQDEDGVQLELAPNNFPEFDPSAHAEYFQLWSCGEVLKRSASLGSGSLNPINGDLEAPSYQAVRLPDGRRGHAVGLTFLPRQENEDEGGRTKHHGSPSRSMLVIAKETGDIERTLGRLRLLLVTLGIAAILASAGILAWSVRRGLHPVAHLADRIANLGESDLAARVDSNHIPTELMPIVQRLNELLARLEAAFNRERVFTADVAHELRTPLAGLQTMLEIALSKPREPQGYQQTISGCLAITQQMHQMVVNLLHLARADAHQLPIAAEPVDVVELIRECWKPLGHISDERRLHVEWRLPEQATLNSDPGILRLVFTNLLDNAVSYAEPGGQIAIETTAVNDRFNLRITNTGSQVPAEAVEHVFDRFWRGDASRCAVGQRCGLGLSLCRKLVTLLGGSISAQSIPGKTFTILVVLPVLARSPYVDVV